MRPKIDISSWRPLIESELSAGTKHADILQMLANEGVHIKERTFAQRLSEWQLHTYRRRDESRATIVDSVRYISSTMLVDDQQGADILNADGLTISHRSFRKIRQELGIYRSRRKHETEEVRASEMHQILQQEYDNGRVESYGRRLLFQHLQQQYGITSR